MPDPTGNVGTDGFPKTAWSPPPTGVQFAPGGESAAHAAGHKPASPAPAVQAALAVPVPGHAHRPAPIVRDLSGRSLIEVYDVQWPKEVDGVEIRQVVLKRMSTGEVTAFVDHVRAVGEAAESRFPIFYRVDGTLLSDDEWNALDTDDTDALAERADGFLPARFRSGRTSSTSGPTGPATTGNSSAGSRASA